MSSRYVWNAVKIYLAANWTATRVIDNLNLFTGMDDVTDQPLEEWVTVMPSEAIETQVSVGAVGQQRWREEGEINLIAFVPSGTGVDRALELAEALRDMFRAAQITDGQSDQTIVFRQVDPPDTALPASVDSSHGNWFGYAVTAVYYTDVCQGG